MKPGTRRVHSPLEKTHGLGGYMGEECCQEEWRKGDLGANVTGAPDLWPGVRKGHPERQTTALRWKGRWVPCIYIDGDTFLCDILCQT